MTLSPNPRLTVIEASAGTGKTHRITELVVQRVLEGVPIERILVVTFTRAATAELRDRIRHRLSEVAATDGTESETARHALTSFDLATITTIHGFCHQVLTFLGALDDSSTATISMNDGIADEVINDAILREFAPLTRASPLLHLIAPASDTSSDKPAATETTIRSLIRLMLTHPTGELRSDEPGWTDFLDDIRRRVLQRRLELGVITHDDIIRRALHAVASDSRHARTLGERYQFVLIDEFQDTDALQWQVFSLAFLEAPEGSTEVVVVGDPKQAIYGFRGADVHAYLQARTSAGHRDTLDHNWRMEPALINAINLVFRGSAFGHEQIVHHDVAPPDPEQHPRPVLLGDSLAAPFSIRVVPNDHNAAYAAADRARRLVAADVAEVVAQLLSSQAVVCRPAHDQVPLQPSDIAVLVGKHADADLIADALHAVGIASVRRGDASVANGQAASHWQWLIAGMERPASVAAASLAAISWFVGWSAAQLAEATDDDLLRVQEQLTEWRRVLARGGIPALLAAIRAKTELTRRLLTQIDGERALTDIEHLGEVLHAAVPGPTAPAALADALASMQAQDEQETERLARRIDTDDDAIQLLTIHAGKGLEFAVTLVPFAWLGGAPSKQRVFHENDHLVLDVTPKAPADESEELANAEAFGAEQRLMYVALTRAKYRTVVWWGTGHRSPRKAITELLVCRSSDGFRVDPSVVHPPGDHEAAMRGLQALAHAGAGSIAISVVQPGTPTVVAASTTLPTLSVSSFEYQFQNARRRHSFSSIAAPATSTHFEMMVAADDEMVGTRADLVTEPDAGLDDVEQVVISALAVSALAAIRTAGTEFGTAFHSVMEALEFTAPMPAEAERVLDATWPWRELPVHRPTLVAGIQDVLLSPTGSCFGDRPLATLSRRDRLDELTFELAFATSGPAVRASDIAALLLDHLGDDDPFRDYAPTLSTVGFDTQLVGHLNGSIDLVARIYDAHGQPRFVICDYKTNRLPDYHPDRLPAAMVEHHYPLQALLYGVALHRYLRWRQPGYEPARHLGGAAYLFVRGMAGPATQVVGDRPFGVCSWAVPPALTVALSNLLDGRQP